MHLAQIRKMVQNATIEAELEMRPLKLIEYRYSYKYGWYVAVIVRNVYERNF